MLGFDGGVGIQERRASVGTLDVILIGARCSPLHHSQGRPAARMDAVIIGDSVAAILCASLGSAGGARSSPN